MYASCGRHGRSTVAETGTCGLWQGPTGYGSDRIDESRGPVSDVEPRPVRDQPDRQ